MRDLNLIKSNWRRYPGSLIGIFFMMLIVSLSFSVVISVRINSGKTVYREMDRLGYGDLTVWISRLDDPEMLITKIEALEPVEKVNPQEIVYAGYQIHGHHSDSEGQLISYSPGEYSYRFFKDDLSGYRETPEKISEGEIYLPVSMKSMFGAEVGDRMIFAAARNGVDYPFTVKGFFEDPFMGSSMIGMKSFLISPKDREKILKISAESGIDSLARGGFMLHVFQNEKEKEAVSQLNNLLNTQTSLPTYTEFVHSKEVLAGFMLLLQNIFSGLILAFVVILLLTVFFVLSRLLSHNIEEETPNIGVLKTFGYTGKKLRFLQIVHYLPVLIFGVLAGIGLSPVVAKRFNLMTLTSTGILVPESVPVLPVIGGLLTIIVLFLLFIFIRTSAVSRITPVSALRKRGSDLKKPVKSRLKRTGLSLWMAVRQIISGKKNYIGSLLIALLLVFFVSLIGRMNDWLGPNGEGLMDAFNPADLHLGVQIFSDLEREEIESVIEEFSPITDRYDLAMPNIALNGVDYGANVITDPKRFHILKGETSSGEDQVVLTEFLAGDLGVDIGDKVQLSAESGSAEFTVSGFYQCANDMGMNIGLSKEGYLRIAGDDPHIWCVHYFIEDPEMRIPVMEHLDELYKADIYVHENGWPGLYGIISAMRSLMLFMYIVAALIIFIAVNMSGSRIIKSEQHDLAVLRIRGVNAGLLQLSFTFRFFLVTLTGSIGGFLLSAFFSDPLINIVMKFSGISDFSSHPGVVPIIVPIVVIVLFFTLFSAIISGRIKRKKITGLISSD